MGMTIVQARNDLLSKLGITDATLATTLQLQDVAFAINAAMQMLHTAGEEFFTKEEVSITLSAGTATYTIPTSVQSVLGGVKWGTKVLRALQSEGEFSEYARLFLGGTAWGQGSNGDPSAYWIDFERTGDIGDVCLVRIMIAPPPTAPAGSVTMEVVNDAPIYTTDNLDDTTELPVAHNYAESIFLPLARMFVTRSSNFSRPDILPQITEDAKVAMARLGLAGGFPNAKAPKLPREVEG